MLLNPYWVAGFVDGEGCFYVGINKNTTMASGYQILPELRIVQHERDIKLLYALKEFWGAGVVRVNHEYRYELRIRDIAALSEKVIPFFEKYQLQTQKRFDFMKFKKIISWMHDQKHLSREGIIRIIAVAAQMNRRQKYKALAIERELQMDKDKVHTC